MKSLTLPQLFLIAAFCASPLTSNAVLLRDDVSKQRAINLAASFAAVGHFPGCTATYIGAAKAITAAHCIDGGVVGSQFTLGTAANQPIHQRTIVSVAKNPRYAGKKAAFDVAILTLESDIPGVVPMFLSGRNRVGKTATIVGFGDTGNGLSRNHKNGREIKRAAKNKIDVLVPSNFRPERDDRGAYYLDFDSPDRDANTLKDVYGFKSSASPKRDEGDAGPGDSGGPLISGGGVVAIVSAGFNDIGTDSEYGTIGIFAPLLQPNNIAWLASQGVVVHGRGSTKGSSQSSSSRSNRSGRSDRDGQFGLMVVDQNAIASAIFSGLPMANAVQSGGIRAARLGTRDVNSRLTRLRARRRTGDAIFSGSPQQVDAKLSLFLDFANRMGIDASEALGLKDKFEPEMAEMIFAGGPFASAAAMPIPLLSAAGADPGKHTIEFVDSREHVWEIFANGNVGVYDQDPLGDSYGFTTEAGSGAIGVEHHLNDSLAMGLAWSYVDGNTDVVNVGGYDTEGWAVSAYASYFNDGFWGDLLYSYGAFDIDSNRGSAIGETEANTHQIDFNLGYNFETPRLVHGPIFGLNFLTGKTDAFAETGGGATNLSFDGTNSQPLTSLLGWQTTWTREVGNGLLTAQLRAGWGHEHIDDTEATTVSLSQSPFLLFDGSDGGGFGTTSRAERPGSDYFSVGFGVDLSTNEQFFIGVDYETRLLWDDASEHFGSLRAGYRF